MALLQTFVGSYGLTLAILIPALLCLITIGVGRNRPKPALIVSVFAVLISLAFLLIRGYEMLATSPVSEVFLWIPPVNINFSFMLDGLSLPIMVITAIITILIMIYSFSYIKAENNIGIYYANILLLYVGMQGVFSAADLFLFYLFWELTIIPAFLLLLFWRETGTNKTQVRRTGLKFFLWTHIGSLILLAGILQIVVATGTSSLLELPTAIANATTYTDLLRLASIAMIFGFSVKIGIVPLHSWLPDTYVHSPTPVTAAISGLMAKIGAYGLVRAIASWFPTFVSAWIIPLGIVSLVSIIYGSFLAIGQPDLKRLLAFSSISQAGYILLGVASVTILGIGGAALHIVNHAILKSLLFLCAGVFITQVKTSQLDSLRGLGTRMPITSSALLIGAFGLAGIPPLNGFVSEVLIFAGIFSNPIAIIIAVPAIIAVILTFSYLLWIIYRLFVSKPSNTPLEAVDPPFTSYAPLIILALLVILIGLWPSLVLNPISQWIETLTLGGP